MNRSKLLAVVILSPAVTLFGTVSTLILFRLKGAELVGGLERTISTQVSFLAVMKLSNRAKVPTTSKDATRPW